MPTYRYLTADIFTNTRFGGNQLAVLPDARGLTSEQMQTIAREFNYSESTFVLPPENPANTRRVRIFTPASELPFAGHPTVGTAFVLATIGDVAITGDETRIVLEEGVGPVPVVIRARNGKPSFCQFAVAKLPEFGSALPARADMAAILSLDESDLLDGAWRHEVGSCGVPFALVPVRNRAAVARSRLRLDLWEKHMAGKPGEMVMLFAMEAEEPGHDVRARMYGPSANIVEDPATGSACAALGGYLALRSGQKDGTLRWVIEQGYEMGRPSLIDVEADKKGDTVTAVRVGGDSVLVTEGTITI